MLEDLIERLTKASGPDRELDLAINLAIHPDGEIAKITAFPRGLTATEGMRWDIWHGGSVVFEKRESDGRCNYNGGYPLPAYTTSIDAALTLVPTGYDYEITINGTADEETFTCAAVRWWEKGRVSNNGSWHHRDGNAKTTAIALCIASLKSRSAQAGDV